MSQKEEKLLPRVVVRFLPLWSQNGITVTAWEGDYLSFGRWVPVLAGLGSLVPVFVKSLLPTL